MSESRKTTAPEEQLEFFLAKFTPEISARAGAIVTKMRKRLPNAFELVYDNYNALAIGFAPDDKASHAIFSIAVFPRWVSLFFLQGKALDDPSKMLKGNGSVVRHIVLENASALDKPVIRALMQQALDKAALPLNPSTAHRLIIKSVSAKQRPRRPPSREEAPQ
jgi:hypothetical protein